jgi:fumarate hydratase class I
MDGWADTLTRLIERASTDIPADVEAALVQGLSREEPGGNAAEALTAILENIRMARERRLPLCQDTGTLIFRVDAPGGVSMRAFRAAAEQAVRNATGKGILRPNAVDAVTGINSGTNLGPGSPQIHWEERDGDTVAVALMLKGGGSENVSAQYSLPDAAIGAGRDLEGVRRCVLHALHRAQGMGCAPGILGVGVGGDRTAGFLESKRQLLRPLGSVNPQAELAALETTLLAEGNALGIGPMGFGGRTTILGVHLGALHRVPASFFVTVAYMCWACRRQRLEATLAGAFIRWLD